MKHHSLTHATHSIADSLVCDAIFRLYNATHDPTQTRDLLIKIVNSNLTQMSRFHHELINDLPCTCPDCKPKQ